MTIADVAEVHRCLTCGLTLSINDAYWHWKSGHSTTVRAGLSPEWAQQQAVFSA